MKEVPVLYLCFHKKLYNCYGCTVVNRKDVLEKMGEIYKIPKNLRVVIMKEMEDLDMISKINRDKIKINSCMIDVEENISRIYYKLGMF